MGITNSGDPSCREPQEMVEEFEAQWTSSKQRAESRPRPDLEELKELSSQFRRVGQAHLSPWCADQIGRNRQYDWLMSSNESGFAPGAELDPTGQLLVGSQPFGVIGAGV